MKKDSSGLLYSLFELPELETMMYASRGPETSRPQQVKAEPASPTEEHRPVDDQSLTEMMRDRYPFCWEIGLDLRVKPEDL